MSKYWWIKERHNPQLGVYYVGCGKMTAKEATRHEGGAVYGYNVMLKFASEKLYAEKIFQLRASGEKVQP